MPSELPNPESKVLLEHIGFDRKIAMVLGNYLFDDEENDCREIAAIV